MLWTEGKENGEAAHEVSGGCWGHTLTGARRLEKMVCAQLVQAVVA